MKSIVMVVAATLACLAFADGPEGGARPEGGRRGFGSRNRRDPTSVGMDPIVRMVSNPSVAEKIGLSDEQKAKLEELNKGPKTARESQKKVHAAMERQIELMKAEKIDEAAVMAAIDEVFELRKAMAKEQAKRVIAVKSILTPEQIARAHEEMKNMFASRGDRGARRDGKDRDFRGPHRGKGTPGDKGPKPGADRPVPAPEPEAK